ncbi:major facilitator superfamily domain-containing protein [Spinellus fusiger]|nr:major facilitator superfamily domain-containing protein [Spinellus fusiger]
MTNEMDVKVPLLRKKPPMTRYQMKRSRSSFEASTYNSTTPTLFHAKPTTETIRDDPGLHLSQLLALTLCMAGVQFIWTVELSYGTPYLLSLHLSKELTALVWLAGPLSGLLVQPVIGAFSDKCTSRFGRRRPFILVGGILTCLSTMGIAYTKEIAHGVARFLHSNTSNNELIGITQSYAIVVAVTSFYFMDFTLNAVQAICRALILDIPPIWQQDDANAWSARMSNMAMVVGYSVGFVDLVKYTPWLGDSQVKVFCVVAIGVFIATLTVTCVSIQEKSPEPIEMNEVPWHHTFVYIWRAFRFLPRPMQTLCNTQFFAWMGWFPFLFYSTQWISDIYFFNHPPQEGSDDWSKGTRAGSFALLCYSIVSVLAGVMIPMMADIFANIKHFSLLNIYTTSHLIAAAALLSAWFVTSVTSATIVLAVMGVSWAIVLWVPFSLVGEYVSYEDKRRQMEHSPSIASPLASSSSTIITDNNASNDTIIRAEDQKNDFDAGMILGVHNMYIVFPQFVVAILSSLIFALVNIMTDKDENVSSVAFVLAFGGFMALIAAGFSRRIVRVV